MNEMEFEGRVALVTGGSRGIGRAACLKLARSGARVVINYAENRDSAEETKNIIEKHGGEVLVVRADVSNPGEVEAMVRTAAETFGPADLLVTSAGIIRRETHDTLDFSLWQEIMRVNLDGTFLPVMAVKDGMLERGFGRIVCIASIAGLRARPRNIAYSSSKAAVIGFVRSCASALAPGIRINCVAPGLIDTDMIRDLNPKTRQTMIDATPMKRTGTPDEMANLVHFLLSEQSSFTTGQTYVASGGRVTLP